jgi:hypothetical protein
MGDWTLEPCRCGRPNCKTIVDTPPGSISAEFTGCVNIVRRNLMEDKGYAPYCGADKGCNWPRAKWDGDQFKCPCCGWRSQFPADFIDAYKAKWM